VYNILWSKIWLKFFTSGSVYGKPGPAPHRVQEFW